MHHRRNRGCKWRGKLSDLRAAVSSGKNFNTKILTVWKDEQYNRKFAGRTDEAAAGVGETINLGRVSENMQQRCGIERRNRKSHRGLWGTKPSFNTMSSGKSTITAKLLTFPWGWKCFRRLQELTNWIACSIEAESHAATQLRYLACHKNLFCFYNFGNLIFPF